MIKECTELGKDCGNCSHSYSDGMYAPNCWCKIHNPKGNVKYDTYMRYDEKHPGTTCNDFLERIHLSNKEWTKLIADEFKVSNSVAKEMLHAMYEVVKYKDKNKQ